MTVTLEDLNKEYTNLCTRYGDVTLRLEALKSEGAAIKVRVDELAKHQQELLKKEDKKDDLPT